MCLRVWVRIFEIFVSESMWFTWLKTCFYLYRCHWMCCCVCDVLAYTSPFRSPILSLTRSLYLFSSYCLWCFRFISFYSFIVYFAYVFHISQICTYFSRVVFNRTINAQQNLKTKTEPKINVLFPTTSKYFYGFFFSLKMFGFYPIILAIHTRNIQRKFFISFFFDKTMIETFLVHVYD